MKEITESQKFFYLKKFQQYGDSPLSLSWNDKKTQYLRFQKIAELFKYEHSNRFSVHEIGCGLAHFKEFLNEYPASISYSGSDIVEEFIGKNKIKFPECPFFVENISNDLESINDSVKGYDYYCLNGTFHTKEQNSIENWENFVFKSTKICLEWQRKGYVSIFLPPIQISMILISIMQIRKKSSTGAWSIVQDLYPSVMISHYLNFLFMCINKISSKKHSRNLQNISRD